MKHLALLGASSRLPELAAHLYGAGFAVTLLPLPAEGSDRHGPAPFAHPGLALAVAARSEELGILASAAERHALPWLCLCANGPEGEAVDLTTTAYQAGALAVLPAGSAAELVTQAVERSIESLSAQARGNGPGPRQRHYRSGETIPLGIDEVLRVRDGVVAQVAWHEDGAEGLLGLWGPDHLLTGHGEDTCGLSLRAHTEAVVEVDRLDPNSDSFGRLLERIRRLEAWSSVQSRQNMQQRLLGMLALLAEQFGTASSEGILIDLRITHAQLAHAIGSTRATVTRLLGPLRRQGLVRTVRSPSGERFCLPERPPDRDPRAAGAWAAAKRA